MASSAGAILILVSALVRGLSFGPMPYKEYGLADPEYVQRWLDVYS